MEGALLERRNARCVCVCVCTVTALESKYLENASQRSTSLLAPAVTSTPVSGTALHRTLADCLVSSRHVTRQTDLQRNTKADKKMCARACTREGIQYSIQAPIVGMRHKRFGLRFELGKSRGNVPEEWCQHLCIYDRKWGFHPHRSTPRSGRWR